MVRLRFVVLVAILMTIAPSARAGKLEKDAIEVGPGVEPPKVDAMYSSNLHDIPSSLEGTVTARVLIDAAGDVRKVKIQSSTDARLSNHARQVLTGAKYSPAKRDGGPVSVWWTESLNFVSAEAEIASILACDPSKLDSRAAIDPKDNADLVLPVLVRNALPQATSAILRRGAGFATLSCVIDVCGRIRDCNVLASSGSEYAGPAIAAARERLYRPARRHGEPVAVYSTIRISFEF